MWDLHFVFEKNFKWEHNKVQLNLFVDGVPQTDTVVLVWMLETRSGSESESKGTKISAAMDKLHFLQ